MKLNKVIVIMVSFLFSISSQASYLFFKYPFTNITKLTSKIIDYTSQDKYEIITHFTHNNEIWRVEQYKQSGHRKSFDGFVIFDSFNYEKFNHKRAKIEIGTLDKKNKYTTSVAIKNNKDEEIGVVKYFFNELGYVLSISQSYFHSNAQKEIQNIYTHFQYNCANQLIFYSVSYNYFTTSHKYKRKSNGEYQIVNCNPDSKGNFKDIYYNSVKNNSILKFEKRHYTYK